MKALLSLAGLAALSLLASCGGRDPENTGTEFASQMYHSIPYEPYSQVVDTNHEDYNSNPYNENRLTMRKPVAGTIRRKLYEGEPRMRLAADIMEYNLHPDSFELAGRTLRSPLPASDKVLAEGKTLYLRFCSPCHGPEGAGNGTVAGLYKGVPAYNTGRVKNDTEGHIYHTITYGKGRMWPHGHLINPDERWKIVRYVQTLQQAPAQ